MQHNNGKEERIDLEAEGITSFVTGLAINDQFLTIGDRIRNQVILFNRNSEGKWARQGKISPPEESISYRDGFGSDLELDGNLLAISATTQHFIETVSTADYYSGSTSQLRYLVRLNSSLEPQAFRMPVERKSGFIRFNLLTENRIREIVLTDKGKFSESVAIHRNLLLIASVEERCAWLFDLDKPKHKPLKINCPHENSTDTLGMTVAISGHFAVIHSYNFFTGFTLIRSLNNNSHKILEGGGQILLVNNILTRFNPADLSAERYSSLLEVFSLDSNATPHLISKRQDIDNIWLQNGFLVTFFTGNNYDDPGNRIYIKPLY